MAGKSCVTTKQEMTEKATASKGQTLTQSRIEHTRLQEWALMCFTIVEETNETLHSALGSSGSFLGDRKVTLVIYSVNITWVYYWDAVVSYIWAESAIPVPGTMFFHNVVCKVGFYWAQRWTSRGNTKVKGRKASSFAFMWNCSLEATESTSKIAVGEPTFLAH